MSAISKNPLVKYKFNDNYLLRNFSGKVTMETIIESWEFILGLYYRDDKLFQEHLALKMLHSIG